MVLIRKLPTDPLIREAQIAAWLDRYYSWSQHSQWKSYGKEGWYSKYILGQITPPNKEMIFGSMIGKKLETDPTFLPQIPRQKKMEYEFKATLSGINFTGYADAYDEDIFHLEEYKTGKTPWTQKRVDDHGQITLYLLMRYLSENVKPEDHQCRLHWLPTCDTEDGEITLVEPFAHQTFHTTRTLKELLLLAAEITKTRKEMEIYARKHF